MPPPSPKPKPRRTRAKRKPPPSPYSDEQSSEAVALEDAAAPHTLDADLTHLPPGMREKVVASRVRGLTMRDAVLELHVRQSLPMSEVGKLLGLSRAGAHHHWNKLLDQITEYAPRTPKHFEAMRELISAKLWRTVQHTSPPDPPPPVIDLQPSLPVSSSSSSSDSSSSSLGSETPAKENPNPPVLAIHIKTLELLAKLYGLTIDPTSSTYAPSPYATPEEIAASARDRILALHERSE